MKTDPNKPFRFTRGFWLAYIFLGAPVLWFAKPWSWELPGFSRVAGLIFLPFAAAIVCYCPFLFVYSLVRGSSKERKIGGAFLAAPASASIFLTFVWFIYDFGSVSPRFGFFAVIIANLVFAILQEKEPNQTPEPTAPSGRGSS